MATRRTNPMIDEEVMSERRRTLARYLRFMSLKATTFQLQQRLTQGIPELTPGIDWRGHYCRMRGAMQPGSSKSHMAEKWAVGEWFIPGSLEVLEDEFGTRWEGNGREGLE